MTAPYPTKPTRKEIVFIRHAQSVANLEGVWAGRSDFDLSEAGEASLELLGKRMIGHDADVVISSSLKRSLRTAASFSEDVQIDDGFIEIDLGDWDGVPFSRIEEEEGDYLAEALSDFDKPMGHTGESINQAGRRMLGAVDDLAAKLPDDGKAVVVTHGGAMQSVLHRHLAGKRRRIHAFTENTAISKVVWSFGRPRLAMFNDTGHLGPRSDTVAKHIEQGTPVLALVRHGQTRANVERRWQGHGDWSLDELGEGQAQALGRWFGRHRTVYSSPLIRARQTAEQIAANGVVHVENLKELAMGEWEGLTTDEIIEHWPELMDRIYRDGVDLRRGRSGESWGELTARFRTAVESLEKAQGDITVVVAHGGAIRSYVASLTSVWQSHAESLFTPGNTSVTHVALTDRGPELLDFSVAPHLEELS